MRTEEDINRAFLELGDAEDLDPLEMKKQVFDAVKGGDPIEIRDAAFRYGMFIGKHIALEWCLLEDFPSYLLANSPDYDALPEELGRPRK